MESGGMLPSKLFKEGDLKRNHTFMTSERFSEILTKIVFESKFDVHNAYVGAVNKAKLKEWNAYVETLK
jgi:hypothetical protein